MHGRDGQREHRGRFHEEGGLGTDRRECRDGADSRHRGRRADRTATAGDREQVLVLQPLDDLRGVLRRMRTPQPVHVLGDRGRLQARPGIE